MHIFACLTFRGHPRSKVTLPIERPNMVSYWCKIHFLSPRSNIFKDIKHLKSVTFSLTFQGHQRSKYQRSKGGIWFPVGVLYIHNALDQYFPRYKAFKIHDLEFDLSASSEVKCIITNRELRYGFK